MKISRILNEKNRTLSFEVFPPKSDSAYESVCKATEEIASLSPDFISVTYGAGGGTSEYTLDISQNIEKKYHIPVLTHITCVSSSKSRVKEYIKRINASGIENVMALRGDIPAGRENEDRTAWDYHHASDLISEIQNCGYDFCIGGACYPEVHPESVSEEDDLRHLKMKVDSGCDFLTTQMFFDNSLFYRFLEKTDAAGITVPVIPGIMPVTTISQAERARTISGSYMPSSLLDDFERFRNDPASVKQVGLDYALQQINDLYSHGIRNVHVYTMNKADVALYIRNGAVK